MDRLQFPEILQGLAGAVLLLCLSVLPALAAIQESPSGVQRSRVAIVIGNSDYRSSRLEHLPNAANDATSLAESLRRLNFDVLVGTDLTKEGFEKIFRDADAKLSEASAVLIFYAGHGVQLQGKNYLLPVDTPDPDSLQTVTDAAVKLDDVIARYASRDRQTFIFLDACRNNPLGSGASAGLAQVEVGENMFVAFATQPGNVTVDGSGSNSPFTTALLKNLEVPGLSISDMMIRVRNATEAMTVGRQVPWDQSNLREQFYFTEQQVLDPARLSASLSRILADPSAKKQLQNELASNDLQTAVLIVGQTLRSVEITPPSPNSAAAPGDAEMASLSPAETTPVERQSVATGLETLIVGSQGTDSAAKAADLAAKVQTELRRLGCYRLKVDGDWGRGSVRALQSYYRNTKQKASDYQPSFSLLSDLFLHSGRVCKEPVIVRKPPATLASDAGSPGGGSTRANRNSRSSRGSQRPAAAPPPPDISGGIGIGGIF